MNIAAFADAVRDLVYLDLKTGEIDQDSDSTFLLIRGPADFAEEITLLLDQHSIVALQCATDAQLDRAREALPCEGIQLDDDAVVVVSQGHEAGGVWLSAWLWLPDQIA